MRNQRGQAILLLILTLGAIMAAIVMYGSKRQESTAKTSNGLDNSQAAYEALAAAAKRVQYMYSSESGCDPETLETRLSAMATLPATAGSLGLTFKTAGLMTYVTAQPSLTSPNKENRCTGGTGCRQIAVPIDALVFIVTVGAVSRDPDLRVGDCPRDASVRLTTTVYKNVYSQNVTLTNICSLAACDKNPPDGSAGKGFINGGVNMSLTLSGAMNTTACTGTNANIVTRKYGGGFTSSTATLLTTDDLRWARRYLETGGGDIGETNGLYTSDLLISGNGSCSVAQSAGQCKNKNCFPALDLNRDGVNNEADLAILENFMRGLINSLPVIDF